MIQPERKPSFEYTRKAIETRFKDFIFRSRLEAKWAAMFELMNWEWDYEPCDFNGWIPDFAIYGKKTVYVEVKPVIEFPKDVAKEMEMSGCNEEMLIVGQKCLLCEPRDSDGEFGWLTPAAKYHDDFWWWDNATFGRWVDGKGKIGFCHVSEVYSDRISGGYDGGCFGGMKFDPKEIKRLWANAHNATRWMKSR